jgi:hypothetical protein
MPNLNRRTMLRGALGGVGISVGLPILDAYLNTNGTAFAATGQNLPVRFGTWFWGCGNIPERYTPTATGTEFELPEHLQPLAAHKAKINVLTGFDVKLDGVPNKPHVTGNLGLRTGVPVPDENVRAPTLDVLIGDAKGAGVRFRSLEVSCYGAPVSYSYRTAGSPNPSEPSPVALYQRIFGEGFVDPNAGTFTPDPRTMVRESVLSGVAEDRQRLVRDLGAADRRRLDEYFTSVRALEEQLALQLQPPARVENFTRPDQPTEGVIDSDIEHVVATHRLMAGLMVAALRSNQTKIFNVVFSDSGSSLRRAGDTTTHHQLTHEEPVSSALGFQEQVSFFCKRSLEACGEFIDQLAAVPEGDGTLLDNCLVMAHSDCSVAKRHAVEDMPTILAGSAGGRMRTGQHIAGNGDAVSRIGLTVQQAMGLPVERWGVNSMNTNRTITELMV